MTTEIEETSFTNRRLRNSQRRELCLTITIVLLVIALIIVISLLLIFSSRFLQAGDQSVDPCENFYDFSCANFIRRNPVSDDKYLISTFSHYKEIFELQQNTLIENYNTHEKPSVLRKAQELYNVCLNASHEKQKEIDSFRDYINNELDGWPMAEGPTWKPKTKRLDDYLAKVLKSGLDIELVWFNPIRLPEDPTKALFEVSVRSLILFNVQDIFQAKEGDIFSLKELILKFISLFGDPQNHSFYEDLVQMDKYSEEMNNLSNPEGGKQSIKKLMTFTELNELTKKKIDWLKILRTSFGKNTIKENDKVQVVEPDQFEGLLKIVDRVPRRVLVNRIILSNLINKLIKIIGPVMDKKTVELIKSIGFEQIKSRSEYCLGFVKKILPAAVTRMFVETFVHNDVILEADRLVQLLQKAYEITIENSEWLDKETKKHALEKIRKIKRFIGYPDFIFHVDALEIEYSHISNVKSTHFLNFIILFPEYDFKRAGALLFPPPEKQFRWPTDPLDINAYYHKESNGIYLPLGILQLPFFDINRPMVVNLGMLGSVIGHELGHAFDNTGRQYDAYGNYIQWWTNQTEKTFAKKTECFVDQYSEYCPENIPGKICINGLLTLKENLADNTGLKAAFEAYTIWIKENGKEEPMPGFENFTVEQIFFISFSYMWCENIPNDKWKMTQAYSKYSSGKYRVIGTLSNSKDFRESFGCKKKNLMNRKEESCSVW